MPEKLIVFGFSGDLAGRYLLPALAELEDRDKLPQDLPIIGTGREEWDDEAVRRYAGEQLKEHASDVPEAARSRLLRRLRYRQVDVTEPAQVRAATNGSGPFVAYLALPPSMFVPAIDALGPLAESVKTVVVEKPFGTDLESARQLNATLHRHFSEEQILRVDHFLHLQTAQNVLGLRFANGIFEPLWNARHIAEVEVTWDEVLGLEGRAGYYDDAGALRDIVQNHLLQLFCLVAMEPPASVEGDEIRDRKVEVLRAVREMSEDQVATRTVRGRYTAGSQEGRSVPAYVDEDGVDPKKGTETFAQVTLAVDTRRWAGVPFTLRTGKALAADRHEIVIRFREGSSLAFGEGKRPRPNTLRLSIQPDSVELELMVTGSTAPFELEAGKLQLALGEQDISAYGRLILDAIEGDTGLSIGAAEAEEAWRVFEPVLRAWQRGVPPLLNYAAGTAGPPLDAQ